MISTHTHTQPFNFSKQVVVSLLFFGFLLTTSFQANAQFLMSFGNKTQCTVHIGLVTCNNDYIEFDLAPNATIRLHWQAVTHQTI